MTDLNLAYIVSRFPHLYQTFVRREINALVQRGARVDVYPLAGPRRGGRNDAQRAGTDTPVAVHPAPLTAPATWQRAGRAVRRHPKRVLQRSVALLRDTASHPAHFGKSLVALVKGLAWTEPLTAGGTTHLHAHWSTYPATAARIASDLSGIPFSFAFHAYDIFDTRILVPAKIAAAAFVVVNCRYTLDFIARTYPEVDRDKLVLLYNSLPLSDYTSLPRTPDPTRSCVLAVGQLVPTKGFGDLLEACTRLVKQGIDLQLVLSGNGPLRGSLEATVQRNGMADRVTFVGEQTEAQVRTLLSRAALLAMPCVTPQRGTHDALPNVILEAMAAGVPVVGTKVFGIPEVVEHEQTGLLVPERDPPALAAAIARLLTDPPFANRLAAAARQRAAELFDAETNSQRLLDLFLASRTR